MGGMGWLGPLVDLSTASSHVGDYVQLIVFVHRSNPVQYKLAKGGTIIRTDIHVGDHTRPFFSVSIWNKHLASSISAGDIILLQNVIVTKFGEMIEAKTVHYSSGICLIHPYTSLLSKGVDELMGSCRVVGTAKEKLRKVIEWVQRTRSTLCTELKGGQRSTVPNWKVQREEKHQMCSSLSEVLHLTNPSKVIFYASIGEMFLPFSKNDSGYERMFMSRRLTTRIDDLVVGIICTGCQLCGSPLCSEPTSAEKNCPLYCKKSSNRLHTLGLVYRPFMLYTWDDSDCIPLLVTNKAAELLFGNIRAEEVHKSYKGQKNHQSLSTLYKAAVSIHKHKATETEATESCSLGTAMRSGTQGGNYAAEAPNFYLIFLIMLRMLLLHEKNSPLKFEALVNPSLEIEDGRFEMTSVSFSCVGIHDKLQMFK